jgi:cellulose synthase operon protein C
MTVALLAAGLASTTCARRRAWDVARTRTVVEWGGCAAVVAGPRCQLDAARRLTLWTARADAPEWLFAADQRLFAARATEPVQGGWQISLDVPAGARRIESFRAGDARPDWALEVDDATASSAVDALVAAGKRGDADAVARLQSLAAQATPPERGPAHAGLGRVLLARGQMAEAEPALRAALAADHSEGRLSDEMRDGATLIWGLVVLQQRFADARRILESLRPARDQFPEGAVWYAQSEGLLAAETNDLRDALASYRVVVRSAERLAMRALYNDGAEDLARILVILGRAAEAAAVLERLPSKSDPCAQASLMINRAEALVEAAMHGGEIGDGRVKAALTEERRANSVCLDPHRRLLALVDAARYALGTGDDATSDALVARLRSEQLAKDALAQAWRADVLGRWSLARGDGSAGLKSFEDESAIARGAGLQDERFRAEVGAGESLLALGLRGRGIARLKAAQTLMERMLDGIPLTEGRGTFLSTHDEGARHLVDALVDGGALSEGLAAARFARAMEVAHAARLNRLQSLSPEKRRSWDQALERYAVIRRALEREATEDWALPSTALARARTEREARAENARDTLDAAYRLLVDLQAVTPRAPSSPGRGELEILFFPGAKSWIVFTRDTAGVHARRFRNEALGSGDAAASILEQLSPELSGARRALILASGRADQIDWHAVSWRGKPLVATMEVEYSLDLPGGAAQPPVGKGAATALLVSNPTADLGAATKEVDFVARALGGWQVTRLDGRTATRDALLETLPTVDLFHYAGHAAVAGATGALSALVLSNGQRVELGDLLALPRLPEVVVLSACSAAATRGTDAEAASTSVMGLAQAFLAAGTQTVIAPVRDVSDVAAQSFMASLYEALRAAGPSTFPQAFQRAAAAAAGKDAQSFRLVVH